MQQSMSYMSVKQRTTAEAQKFGEKIRSGEWSLERAHKVLLDLDRSDLDLFQTAGLAQAIACYQCSAD